jgi:hypothetical protein
MIFFKRIPYKNPSLSKLNKNLKHGAMWTVVGILSNTLQATIVMNWKNENTNKPLVPTLHINSVSL